MNRTSKSLGLWLLLMIVITVAVMAAFEPTDRANVVNIIGFFGIVCLAVPTIRVNEQGRIIQSVKNTQTGIDTIKAQMETDGTMSDKTRDTLETDLKSRKDRLEKGLKELTDSKGAWNTTVHGFLYFGYVLVLSAASVRALSAYT